MHLLFGVPAAEGSYPKHSQPVSERRKPDDIFETVKVFGPPLTIDQLQGPDKAAAAALAACPALEVTLLLLFRKVHGDHGGVMSYANHKRKLPYGFDRGARKRPAGTEGLLRWRPEPVGDLPSDVDDGVDWDKVVVEEEEARKAAKPQYYADSDSDANVSEAWSGLLHGRWGQLPYQDRAECSAVHCIACTMQLPIMKCKSAPLLSPVDMAGLCMSLSSQLRVCTHCWLLTGY
jgi:hypothetical protein